MSIRGNRRIRRAWHAARWPRFYWLWRVHHRRWLTWGECRRKARELH